MSIGLKVIMIIISVGTFMYVIRKIRKSQVQIPDISFWILFSLMLIFMVLFPDLAEWAADILGIASTMNFIFLTVIFLLLIELFSLCIKISKLENKIIDLTGEIAVHSEKNR